MEVTIHGHLATRTAGTQLGVWWGGGGLHSEDPASVERPRRRPQARHPRHVGRSRCFSGWRGLDGGGHGILSSLGFGFWMRGCEAWNDIHVQIRPLS